jgi:hypothetical protein
VVPPATMRAGTVAATSSASTPNPNRMTAA